MWIEEREPEVAASGVAKTVAENAFFPILLLRVVDLVETAGPHSPLAALVKVSPAPMLVR